MKCDQVNQLTAALLERLPHARLRRTQAVRHAWPKPLQPVPKRTSGAIAVA